MTHFVALTGERSFIVSPIAMLLRDELTGGPPVGGIRLQLQRQVDRNGVPTWQDTGIAPRVSEEGVFSYPGLGRSADLHASPLLFRLLVEADYYRPLYQNDRNGAEQTGFQFRVHLYNDQTPLNPHQYAHGPTIAQTPDHDAPPRLLPNVRYPFSPQMPVVRGRVVDSSGQALVSAVVAYTKVLGGGASVLTDESGDFAVPIRWPPPNLWPANEIVLNADANSGQRMIAVDRLGGLATDSDIELEENAGVTLSQPAVAGQREVFVNGIRELARNVVIEFQDNQSRLANRRFTVVAINPGTNKVTLDMPLPRRFAAGTPVFSVARLTVDSVNPANREVTLRGNLRKRFTKGTRVLVLAFELSVTHGETPHTEKVKVPDGFRNLTIQL